MSMDNNDQPMPKKTNEAFTHDAVIRDVHERMKLGVRKYGTPLQPSNGRDSLTDAYEEALDLVVYIKNELLKRDAQPKSDGKDIRLANQEKTIAAQADMIVHLRERSEELDVMNGRYKAASDLVEVRSQEVERLRRDNERLSTQLNELNLARATKWPSGIWNLVQTVYSMGWNDRVQHRPDDFYDQKKGLSERVRKIFYDEVFPGSTS